MEIELTDAELRVIREKAEAYDRLELLIELLVEHDIPDDSFRVTVSKSQAARGKTWKEILELAVREAHG